MESWLVNKDSYNGLLQSPHSWLEFHPHFSPNFYGELVTAQVTTIRVEHFPSLRAEHQTQWNHLVEDFQASRSLFYINILNHTSGGPPPLVTVTTRIIILQCTWMSQEVRINGQDQWVINPKEYQPMFFSWILGERIQFFQVMEIWRFGLVLWIFTHSANGPWDKAV